MNALIMLTVCPYLTGGTSLTTTREHTQDPAILFPRREAASESLPRKKDRTAGRTICNDEHAFFRYLLGIT
jgi:hypothetical protein